jgi:hypothetical protein
VKVSFAVFSFAPVEGSAFTAGGVESLWPFVPIACRSFFTAAKAAMVRSSELGEAVVTPARAAFSASTGLPPL